MHTHVRTYVRTYIYTYTLKLMPAHMHTYRLQDEEGHIMHASTSGGTAHTPLIQYIFICTYLHVHTYMCMYIDIHAHYMYIDIYTHMQVYMYFEARIIRPIY